MPGSSRPTLKTIAKLTGLAVPTVSRALSGASDIGLATRERVRKVADEIGYVPNRAGLRLRTGQTHVISLILSSEADVMNLTARLINAAASALNKTPYHMTITPYGSDADIMRPVRHVVETRAADALIFNQVQPEDPRVAYLIEKGFPFATHGRSKWSDQHAYYDYDNFEFGAVAVRALAAQGRRTLRLLAPPVHQNYAQEMMEGATHEAALQGVTLQTIVGLNSDQPSEQIEAQISEVLKGQRDIDGLICASANACMAAVSGLEGAGLEIGKDIDVFSKEAIPFLKRFRPALLSIHEDAWAAGDFLMKAAIARAEAPNSPPQQFLEIPVLSGAAVSEDA